MNEEERICKVYDDLHGIKRTAAEVGVSWYRVVKILSTHGYVLHDNHRKILALSDSGMTPEQIAATLKMNVNVVKTYLPAVRPIYRGQNQSPNAKKIAEWRAAKEGKSK